MDQITDKLSDVLLSLAGTLGSLLLLLLYVVLYFGIATIAKRFIVDRLRGSQLVTRFGRDGELMVYRGISILAYVLATVAILSQMGVHSTGILTLLSAFTVAIGLSLQDVLKNLFSGLFLLAERPFTVGDRVTVRDKVGTIEGIDIRTTMLKTDTGAVLLVPNSVMFTEILQNDSRSHYRYVNFDIETELSRDDLAETVHGALVTVPGVRMPIPAPTLIQRSESTGKWEQIVGYDASAADANRAIVDALIRALPGATLVRKANA